MKKIRLDHEMAQCIEEWGWKYHHLGIPTTNKLQHERYLPQFKFYVSGFSTSPFGIEWMRFEEDSPIHPLIKAIPHIAFEVNDLDYELANRNLNIITPPNPPSAGVRVAMIEHNGAPIELIEFEKNKKPIDTPVENIITDRLILRPVDRTDAEDIFKYRSDVIANKYQGWVPTTLDEAYSFIEDTLSPKINVENTWFMFVVLTANDNKLIGDIGIHFIDKMQIELGYTFDKNFHGKGYATEALKAVIDLLFNVFNKHRITASVDPENAPSIRLLERLSFNREAHFKESFFLRGEWVDDVIYALLKKDWRDSWNR